MSTEEKSELNRFCAEKVMGFEPVCHCGDTLKQHGHWCGHTFVEMPDAEPFNPYENPADAMAVLKKCARKLYQKDSGIECGIVHNDERQNNECEVCLNPRNSHLPLCPTAF